MLSSADAPPPRKLNLTIDDTTQEYRASRSTSYREIKEGRLRTFKIRGRTFIAREEAERWRAACMGESAVAGRA